MVVWSIRPVRSPEPFIDVRVAPGSQFTWRITYEFYDLPRSPSAPASRLFER
jgi:hypothetical protein